MNGEILAYICLEIQGRARLMLVAMRGLIVNEMVNRQVLCDFSLFRPRKGATFCPFHISFQLDGNCVVDKHYIKQLKV